jgi:glutamate 5-kinase
MLTKVGAARRAARSGANTVIAGGRKDNVLGRLRGGEVIGTLLNPGNSRLAARKQWLAGQLRGNGKLVLDDGAVRVLRESGRSLLPIGVREVSGLFGRGEIVLCVDLEGREVARGLVNYSAAEAGRIAGKSSDRIESILGYAGEIEMIHRDNIALSD